MKGLFRGLLGIAKIVVPIAVATVQPQALVNNGVAAVVKHTTPIGNQSIPLLNMGISTAVAFARNGNYSLDGILPAVVEGATLAGSSTLIHQSAKLAVKEHRPNWSI
jgi:hypothetical protein